MLHKMVVYWYPKNRFILDIDEEARHEQENLPYFLLSTTFDLDRFRSTPFVVDFFHAKKPHISTMKSEISLSNSSNWLFFTPFNLTKLVCNFEYPDIKEKPTFYTGYINVECV